MEASSETQRTSRLVDSASPEAQSGWSVGPRGRLVSFIQAGLLTLAAAVFLANNLGNNNLWTDESTTLLTVLGFPDVGAPPVSLVESLGWATYGSGDPGGFQVLLSFWSRTLGTSIEAIRSLPAAFYLIYLISVLALGRLVRLPSYMLWGVMGLLLIESFTKYYAVELRPYSAALAAAVAIPAVTLWLLRRPSLLRFSALAGVVIVVGTSSYTTAVAAAAGAGMIVAGWRQTPSGRSRVWLGTGIAALLVTLPIIYFATGRWQQSATTGPGYTQELMLANGGLAEGLRVLYLNFLSFTALPKTAFLIAVPIAWLAIRVRHQGGTPRSLATTPATILWVYVAITQLASLALSGAGVLPWIMGTRWSIGEVGVVAVSLVGLVSLAVTLSPQPRTWLRSSAAMLSLAATAVGGYALATYERPERPTYEPFIVEVAERYPGRVVIDSWLFSDARYWIEFSGQFDSLRERWIGSQPQENSPPVAVGAEQVEEFIADDDLQALIVRSDRALDDLPADRLLDIQIETSRIDDDAPSAVEAPLALIKRRPSAVQ
jgi:hypothetical protein